MQPTPAPISTVYEPITERPLMQAVAGDVLIRLTTRSDGRTGWAVFVPGDWTHAGSGATLREAQEAVVRVTKERKRG